MEFSLPWGMEFTLPLRDERVMRFKNFWIKKTGIEENLLVKSLSDGEHQLLHSLGLCLLYKDKQCLFLLDEPETHFNPDWRAKFISRLRGCFGDKDAKYAMREMLITTHTPFLISDSHKEYVLVFNKDKSNLVTVSKPEYNTLGASINKITMKTFGKTETISDYAIAILKGLEERFESGESSQALIDEADKILGDSVEKVLFINKLMRGEE
ncbi:MAG: AAA family ATPase [Nitrospirae bacterium]|nr:AAA family ATPase [Nitrospirota bacterium]